MIENKDIDAYLSIKAPDSIKEKLMAEQAKYNRRISSKVRMFYTIAAALLVVVLVYAFLPGAKTEVYCGGILLDKESAVIKEQTNTNARIAPVSLVTGEEIKLDIKTDKETKITVSSGTISAGDSEGVKSITVDSDTKLSWWVSLDSERNDYTLTVGENSYCISQNNKAQWVLSKK
ncbi:MAG: hypothetical protein E7613_02650 [Ruminococcaceae bacterium]|nr:hypothetical protein [Oscillospiraceae bacterium]